MFFETERKRKAAAAARPVLGAAGPGAGWTAMPRAISGCGRRGVRATLVWRWSEAWGHGAGPDADVLPYAAAGARTPGQAGRLAQELGRLMDAVETEGV